MTKEYPYHPARKEAFSSEAIGHILPTSNDPDPHQHCSGRAPVSFIIGFRTSNSCLSAARYSCDAFAAGRINAFAAGRINAYFHFQFHNQPKVNASSCNRNTFMNHNMHIPITAFQFLLFAVVKLAISHCSPWYNGRYLTVRRGITEVISRCL